MDHNLELVYVRLEERFKGRQLLTPTDLSEVLGLKVTSIYNLISQKALPIPLIGKKGRPRARLIDVARYLCE